MKKFIYLTRRGNYILYEDRNIFDTNTTFIRYIFTLEATNGKSLAYATCNVTIKLGEIPAISIVRKKNAPEKIHPFKQFVVRGKAILIKMLYRVHFLSPPGYFRLQMRTLISLIVFSSSYWASGDLH